MDAAQARRSREEDDPSQHEEESRRCRPKAQRIQEVHQLPRLAKPEKRRACRIQEEARKDESAAKEQSEVPRKRFVGLLQQMGPISTIEAEASATQPRIGQFERLFVDDLREPKGLGVDRGLRSRLRISVQNFECKIYFSD